MSPNSAHGSPFRQLALGPFLFGLGLLALGILMVVRPLILVQILMVLLGIAVLLAGAALVLFSLDLWRVPPEWPPHMRIGKWRIWPGDR